MTPAVCALGAGHCGSLWQGWLWFSPGRGANVGSVVLDFGTGECALFRALDEEQLTARLPTLLLVLSLCLALSVSVPPLLQNILLTFSTEAEKICLLNANRALKIV